MSEPEPQAPDVSAEPAPEQFVAGDAAAEAVAADEAGALAEAALPEPPAAEAAAAEVPAPEASAAVAAMLPVDWTALSARIPTEPQDATPRAALFGACDPNGRGSAAVAAVEEQLVTMLG